MTVKKLLQFFFGNSMQIYGKKNMSRRNVRCKSITLLQVFYWNIYFNKFFMNLLSIEFEFCWQNTLIGLAYTKWMLPRNAQQQKILYPNYLIFVLKIIGF